MLPRSPRRARPRPWRVRSAAAALVASSALAACGVQPDVRAEPAGAVAPPSSGATEPPGRATTTAAPSTPDPTTAAPSTPDPTTAAPSTPDPTTAPEATAPSTTVAAGPPVPADSGSGRRIVYERSVERVWIVEADGTVARTYLVSGGKRDPKPGTYKVFSESDVSYSTVEKGARLEHMVRFTVTPRGNNIGFHAIPTMDGVPMQSESDLGRPTSAGCVRQRAEDAAFLYDWAEIGTKVVVLA